MSTDEPIKPEVLDHLKAEAEKVAAAEHEQEMEIRWTKTFKLKNKHGRNFLRLPLKALFGEGVEEIIIEKNLANNNSFRVGGIQRVKEVKKDVESNTKPGGSEPIGQQQSASSK